MRYILLKISTLLLFALAGIVLFWHAPSEAQTPHEPPRFFQSVRDFPVMPGLQEIPAKTLIFDKPEGRIIEAFARIDRGTEQEIKSFYALTLPQLGWEPLKNGGFVRENETLNLDFESTSGLKFLKISIKPGT